ncbi:MAG TPA: hypothetical protein VFJ05_04190 [Nitrososphaeraceae archaeon]|nr:hypothetical protein [Nitrososphaeraceae archaeon]
MTPKTDVAIITYMRVHCGSPGCGDTSRAPDLLKEVIIPSIWYLEEALLFDDLLPWVIHTYRDLLTCVERGQYINPARSLS